MLLHTCCDETPTCENATLRLWLSTCHVWQCNLFAGYAYHDELMSFSFCSRNITEKLGISLEKDPYSGKDWGQEEKGMTEDEMVGWHYWLNGHEFEQTPGDGEGQESLACCSVWGHKELDNSQRLNYNQRRSSFGGKRNLEEIMTSSLVSVLTQLRNGSSMAGTQS